MKGRNFPKETVEKKRINEGMLQEEIDSERVLCPKLSDLHKGMGLQTILLDLDHASSFTEKEKW